MNIYEYQDTGHKEKRTLKKKWHIEAPLTIYVKSHLINGEVYMNILLEFKITIKKLKFAN